jgi:hypothetical protein
MVHRFSHAGNSGGGQERDPAEILRKHMDRQHRTVLVAPGLELARRAVMAPFKTVSEEEIQRVNRLQRETFDKLYILVALKCSTRDAVEKVE